MSKEVNYYNEKRVRFDVYHFIVQGINLYGVELEFDGLDNVYSKCDCPYDYGDVCKHEVAALVTIKMMSQIKR